jgi:hypothetical protein
MSVGLLMVPGGVVGLADTVEGLGFASAVADLACEGEGLLEVGGGPRVVALPPVDGAKATQRIGFSDPVADLAEQGQSLLVMLGGLRVAALPPVDETEVAQRMGFPSLISRERARACWWWSTARG